MSNLIERLRNKESIFVAKDCKEAADELERLTAEIDEIHATGGTSYIRLQAAEAENTRLRDALIEIAAMSQCDTARAKALAAIEDNHTHEWYPDPNKEGWMKCHGCNVEMPPSISS